jgi:hypothetical protein
MDRAGVISSLCFPSFPCFCGQIFYEAHDKELVLLCARAYNDWMIDFLERAQSVYDKQRYWVQRGVSFAGHAGTDVDMDSLDIRQLYLDHVLGCFIDDVHGIKNLHVIGENNVMIETDYPHSDSTWPDSIKIAKDRLSHLDPQVQLKVLRGHADQLFRFTAPVPVDAAV